MRSETPIFRLADEYVADSAALDPCVATSRGIPGFDHLMTDFSPEGYGARRERADAMRATLLAELPTDDADRRAKEFILERLDSAAACDDVGEWRMSLRPLASPPSSIRGTFDLMSRSGEDAWANIAARASAVSTALQGYRATLESGIALGTVSSKRQTLAVAAQCQQWADDRWFDSLVHEAERAPDALPATVLDQVRRGSASANAAMADFAAYLRTDYLARARTDDACGLDRYRPNSRLMNGADLDPSEMYEWAWTDYAELRAEMAATCERIKPGASFAEVRSLLESDPARLIDGEDAYIGWLRDLTNDAIERSLEHFDIPEPMRRCEAHIPPAGSAAAPYYTGPSEDFSRPGRTWYPTLGRTQFAPWGDVTTCYHESVPGHHLQIGYTRLMADSLSRMQRMSFISGHGEGWALYAERLCDEFGWFDNPDHRLGFLAGHMLRSVRVIIDIGMHLGYRIPVGTTLNDGTPFHGGEVWTPELAYEFVCSESGQSPEFLASEIDRYLGWPAQAISYKIGEREWLRARAETKQRLGDRFDLRAFHTHALALGPVGLAQLRTELHSFEG